jgi:aryl-alcohol dehydrogenase-like predicted oxidoreductase
MPGPPDLTRRSLLASAAAVAGAAALPRQPGAAPAPMHMRAIPGSGEALPAIGLGTWITFNVGADPALRAQRTEVVKAFFELGGAVIDSSPMYGTSEEMIGHALARLPKSETLFSATKVWTVLRALGVRQMEASRKYWGLPRFDLMQIHNMLDWQTHLETLKEWKAKGRVRHIGITTSHGRRHAEFARAMAREPFDFVQFTYNVIDREAEQRLLPLAAERKMAVIINRPFQEGDLFDKVRRHRLPDWAAEFDAANWAQFFLKFVISHPAVTCAIPATRRVDHLRENMGALHGRLPDPAMRARMIRHVESL